MRVKANNQDGGSPWSQASSFVETQPGAPGKPAAPTVSAVGSASATVNWSAPPFTGAEDIHDYDVEIRVSGGTWASSHGAIQTVVTSATFTGLNYYGDPDPVLFSASTDYEVRVRANNRILEGGVQTGTRRGIWSDATAFRTAPGAPTGLVAIPGDTTARLLWTAPAVNTAADVHRYDIEHAADAGFTGADTEEVVVVHGLQVAPDWALVPSGLGEGDTFRLLFITSGTRDARSSDIADYNSFVQTEAASGHAAIQSFAQQFTVVASTEGRGRPGQHRHHPDSRLSGVPIYWLGGKKAADDYADFYDGTGIRGSGGTRTGRTFDSRSAWCDRFHRCGCEKCRWRRYQPCVGSEHQPRPRTYNDRR